MHLAVPRAILYLFSSSQIVNLSQISLLPVLLHTLFVENVIDIGKIDLENDSIE